jgi:hypothetical protein
MISDMLTLNALRHPAGDDNALHAYCGVQDPYSNSQVTDISHFVILLAFRLAPESSLWQAD